MHEFRIIWDCLSDILLVILTIIFLRYIIVPLCLLSALSCKKNKVEDPPDVGYDYAPLTIGKYVVYDVDSTVYDDFDDDTIYFKYRIKEKLEENIIDNEGRPAIKLVRYIKKYNDTIDYNSMPWIIKDVWMYTKTATTLEVVEEDVRYTKLAFPVIEDVTWNGNAHNTLGDQDYKYNYIDETETINGTTFSNVLFVEQKDDKPRNAIHRQYFIEKYAKDIGLVYREIKDLYSNIVTTFPDGSIVPVEQRIEKGVIYKLTYVTHGIE